MSCSVASPKKPKATFGDDSALCTSETESLCTSETLSVNQAAQYLSSTLPISTCSQPPATRYPSPPKRASESINEPEFGGAALDHIVAYTDWQRHEPGSKRSLEHCVRPFRIAGRNIYGAKGLLWQFSVCSQGRAN